ncbi:MAG: sulfatase-like hydrolase/transferase [Fuerstiella sp.]
MLLLVSDDQRPDTIAALGNEVIRTPTLDSLVARGTAFTNATCANPICTPARAELLTGCSGFRNGVRDFGRTIDPDLPTLSSWFRSHGYRTAYVGKWHNDGRPVQRGYDFSRGLFRGGGGRFAKPQVDHAGRPVTGYRGWIFQDDNGTLFPELGVGLSPRTSEVIADATVEAIDAIKAASGQPFFVHVNFAAPHDPLMPPGRWADHYAQADIPLPNNFLPQHPFDHGNFDGRDERLFRWPRTPAEVKAELAAYYAVISDMDEQIGRIIAQLQQRDLLQETLIVFTSDHGVAVGSHGLRGKQNMYEHTIGVPLIMAGPGVPQQGRRATDCYLRDLFPTLCELSGIELPKLEGRSLVPALRLPEQKIHDAIYGYFRNSQRMIRRGGWKYLEYPEVGRRQLFNLQRDPAERHNLIDRPEHAVQEADLRSRMHNWFRQHDDPVYR